MTTIIPAQPGFLLIRLLPNTPDGKPDFYHQPIVAWLMDESGNPTPIVPAGPFPWNKTDLAMGVQYPDGRIEVGRRIYHDVGEWLPNFHIRNQLRDRFAGRERKREPWVSHPEP